MRTGEDPQLFIELDGDQVNFIRTEQGKNGGKTGKHLIAQPKAEPKSVNVMLTEESMFLILPEGSAGAAFYRKYILSDNSLS